MIDAKVKLGLVWHDCWFVGLLNSVPEGKEMTAVIKMRGEYGMMLHAVHPSKIILCGKIHEGEETVCATRKE